jgi:dTDP-4-dehydrorhamnose reductase
VPALIGGKQDGQGRTPLRVAVTGAAGLFGYALAEVFRERHTVFPLTRADADITSLHQVRSALARLRPEVIVHAAAIPEPDRCEAEPARAFQVNVHGARHVAEAAREVGAVVAYISTDSVFDGKKSSPYTETDAPLPATVYGRTKLRAERIVQGSPQHWIFRVSVLFGPGKTNFVEKGLRKIAGGEDYVVAADQLGSATYTLDAAQTIVQVVEARRYGLYHLTNAGACSRLDLARRAAELARLNPQRVVGVPMNQMGRRAARLKYAVMDLQALRRAGFRPPRPWQEALADYIRTLPSLLAASSS